MPKYFYVEIIKKVMQSHQDFHFTFYSIMQ